MALMESLCVYRTETLSFFTNTQSVFFPIKCDYSDEAQALDLIQGPV